MKHASSKAPIAASAADCSGGLTPEYLAVMSEVVDFISETVEQSIEAERSQRPQGGFVHLISGLLRAPKARAPAASALGPRQLREAHQLALKKARQLNLSEDEARRLAESVTGVSGEDKHSSR